MKIIRKDNIYKKLENDAISTFGILPMQEERNYFMGINRRVKHNYIREKKCACLICIPVESFGGNSEHRIFRP